MKGKTFLILLAAAGILVAIAFLRLDGEKPAGTVKMGDKLFTDLPVNAVTKVTIADEKNRVTLVKGDTYWQVVERDHYAADFNELREMVVKLSRLKIGRNFTGSTDSLARLSLLPPSTTEPTGKGKQITLMDASSKIVADVILGQTRTAEGGASGGQYLKKVNEETIFLVDENFQFLKTTPSDWLKKEVLNIKADDVAAVSCFTDDATTPVYTLKRPKAGETARLSPVPEGRTADTAKIDQVFDALAPLTLDDVKAVDGTSPAADAGRPYLVYSLYDGRQISIFPASDGKENYTLRIAAKPPVEKSEPAEEQKAESEENTTAADADVEKETKPPAVKSAQQINTELGPWVFSLKKWQFDSLITQPSSLLEAVQTKAAENS